MTEPVPTKETTFELLGVDPDGREIALLTCICGRQHAIRALKGETQELIPPGEKPPIKEGP